MSSFGSKRKARRIQVEDDEDDGANKGSTEHANTRKYPQASAMSLADSVPIADLNYSYCY